MKPNYILWITLGLVVLLLTSRKSTVNQSSCYNLTSVNDWLNCLQSTGQPVPTAADISAFLASKQ